MNSRDRSPVFLFCSGHRSGSTLLQRILIESGEIMVWGETGGALDYLFLASEGYRQMLGAGGDRFRFGFGGNGNQQRESFLAAGENRAHLWIPCINPPQQTIMRGFRRFIDELYAQSTTDLGYQRWGVKKVRSGLETALFMRTLFPEARFIFLVRNPVACMLSIKRHKWMDHPTDRKALDIYIAQWIKTAGSFKDADFGFHIRYEDLVADTQKRSALFDYLGIRGVRHDFFSRSRPKGKTDDLMKLGFMEKLKTNLKTADIAKYYGYA
ncbi:MAG: sulfotransferase [Desulfobacterales bacterium]|jgi:hypothetical protein|nr:sulfotransferase [Desulfobacterales bacterium]